MIKNLSATRINKEKPSDKEKWLAMGGGLYLVIAKKNKNGGGSKRFVGVSSLGTNPKKKYKVPLGIWGNGVLDPDYIISKWREMKVWGKKNNRDLRNYFDKKTFLKVQ